MKEIPNSLAGCSPMIGQLSQAVHRTIRDTKKNNASTSEICEQR